MIIVRRKSIDDIKNMTNHHSNILILGCDGCSGIIQEGGKRQADLMAMSLEMKEELDNESSIEIQSSSILRQCDKKSYEQQRARSRNQSIIARQL